MSKHSTDGMLLEKLLAYDKSKLERYVTIAISVWFFSPIVLMLLNLLDLSSYTYNGIMMILVYLSGCICLIFGGIYLFQIVNATIVTKEIIIESLMPFIVMLALGTWVLVSTLFSEEKRMAVYGYDSFHDNVIMYLFYGGFIFGGLIVALSKKKAPLERLFVIVSAIVSMTICIGAIADNQILLKLITGSAKTSLYDNGTGVSEYYGRLILLAFIFSVYLFINSSRLLHKLFYFTSTICIAISEIVVCERYSFIAMILTGISILIIEVIVNKNHRIKIIVDFVIAYLSIITFSLTLFKEESKDILSAIVAGIDYEKLAMWNKGLQAAQNAIVVGVGPQNTIVNYQNTYLQILVYLGGMGLLLLISLIVFIFKNLRFKEYVLSLGSEKYIVIAMSSYLVLGLFLPTIFTLSPYFCVLLGYIASYGVKELI